MSSKILKTLVCAIDSGTTSNRVLVFNPEYFHKPVSAFQLQLKNYYPKSGWVEQEPMEILNDTKNCLINAIKNIKVPFEYEIKCIGITNQRETTICWDKNTGKPLCRAIVWSDLRTQSLVEEITKSEKFKGDQNFLRSRCGLPVSTYFSGIKLRWMIENSEDVKKAVIEKRCMFGTVDTWLIWNLTGGLEGGNHRTDLTNASRTMLMNLKTLDWDKTLFEDLNIPFDGSIILPKICPTSFDFGKLKNVDPALDGLPILGCIGDQQAAMAGHMCFKPGEAKCTYGTGCFLLGNTGEKAIESKNGLLTTLLYQVGSDFKPVYALEGSIPTAGSGVNWLRDNLNLFETYEELDELVRGVNDTGGVYFIPAFSGLFAPHWRSDARGTMFGITGYTKRGHILRSMFEAVCFQTKEVLEAMELDSGTKLRKLHVDGGMTNSDVVLQLQADLLNVPICRPDCVEATAIGSAIMASIQAGIIKGLDEVPKVKEEEMKMFTNMISEEERDKRFAKWKLAISKAVGWKLDD